MPKDVSKAGHRGIGFVTFAAADALERVMATTHSLHGTELAVDRAEPKAQACIPPDAHLGFHCTLFVIAAFCFLQTLWPCILTISL